ncbi:hypothetical protein HRE53_30560 (plasmid) [Acaryochloris sp. 'Moss Beach']|uniref:hypothetical protein n=1 Tax=Acaryochloris sp. 'Moss Beach' TaxID=2740837 RepID=UPI001F245EE2|nr:hypothetical protein [Acaryochloris sp. 'Moss Beach']UJB72933.1 hypothetical protein HRE53_30560 [Acaryochloris sp. 'Moss Beach']
MEKRQAILLSVILTASQPALPAKAQISGLDSLFTIGQNIFGGNTAPPGNEKDGTFQQQTPIDTGSIQGTSPDIALPTGGNVPTTQAPSADNASYSTGTDFDPPKSSFLKDIFLGADPTGQREISPTTIKFYDILGKVNTGYQTYKAAKGVYRAVQGKNVNGVVGGIESILALYGLIDPNAAAAAVATRTGSRTIRTIYSPQTQPGQPSRIKEVAAKSEPQTAYGAYYRGRNNKVVRSTAAQQSSEMVFSKSGQELIAAQEKLASETVDLTNEAIADAGISSTTVRQYAAASGALTGAAYEESGKAQSANSSQRVLKHNSRILGIATQQSAVLSSQLTEINDNQVRQMTATGNLVALKGVELDKLTTLQAIGASQLVETGSLLSEIRYNNDSNRKMEIREMAKSTKSFGNIYVPIPDDPNISSTQARQN